MERKTVKFITMSGGESDEDGSTIIVRSVFAPGLNSSQKNIQPLQIELSISARYRET